MIRAAIVGLGWWGQNLVNSVADSAALRFVAANTRTRQTAEAFCRDIIDEGFAVEHHWHSGGADEGGADQGCF